MAQTRATAKQVTFKGDGTGAVVRNIHDKLGDTVSVKDFGAVGDGVTDDTAAIQAAINAAISSKLPVFIPGGTYIVSDTIQINNSQSLTVQGCGERITVIKFNNAIVDKVMFDLTKASSRTVLKDLFLEDENAGTSSCIRMTTGRRPDDLGSIAHYKDSLERCSVSYFKVAVHFDTDADRLNGNEHAFLSESLFLHTRFKNNRTTFLVQNIQAVDITLIGTDIENDDSGEEYTVITDSVGASFRMFGGSVVIRGKFYSGTYLPGSVSLWQAGKLYINDTRFELRGGRTLDVISLPISTAQINLSVEFDSCFFLCFAQDLKFVDYLGKSQLIMKNCRALSGSLTIEQRPYQGYSATYSGGYYLSSGWVKVTDSYNIKYNKGTPVSGVDSYVAPVTIKNIGSDGSFSSLLDANGFLEYDASSYNQWGAGLNALEYGLVGYGIDRPTSGFGDVKLKLPYGARPCKLVMYKEPQIRTSATEFELYAVKDEADWASSTFDYTLDAVLLCTTGVTTNNYGEFEASVRTTSSYFTGTLKAGSSNWTEGRIYLRAVGGVQNHGMVGVKYL